MRAPNTCARGKQRGQSKSFHSGPRDAEHITSPKLMHLRPSCRTAKGCRLPPRELCARIAKKNPILWRKKSNLSENDDCSINTERVCAKRDYTGAPKGARG